jgi:hypothetical protein
MASWKREPVSANSRDRFEPPGGGRDARRSSGGASLHTLHGSAEHRWRFPFGPQGVEDASQVSPPGIVMRYHYTSGPRRVTSNQELPLGRGEGGTTAGGKRLSDSSNARADGYGPGWKNCTPEIDGELIVRRARRRDSGHVAVGAQSATITAYRSLKQCSDVRLRRVAGFGAFFRLIRWKRGAMRRSLAHQQEASCISVVS